MKKYKNKNQAWKSGLGLVLGYYIRQAYDVIVNDKKNKEDIEK